MAGWILAAIVASSLTLIGAGAIVAPRMSAAQYGIVLDDPRSYAFLRAMGVRDLAIGVIFWILLATQARTLLAACMIATVPIAAADFVIVARDRRATTVVRGRVRAPLLHAAGALGLLATALVLHAGN